jgi:two-component system sensor histidine kinase FlrB
VHLYTRENTLRLCVSDSGSGIDDAVLARLGEPFLPPNPPAPAWA